MSYLEVSELTQDAEVVLTDEADEPLDDFFEVFHANATDLISGGRSEFRL
ncbi:MAG: hypothetical protein HYR56_34005 [Acidobacteria bacterium]|nr:hypothetical protein [Acidobacteriota bacterium]MBI3427761.1 hypothetical protein [Acidobacteriota bacterium]